MWEKGKRAWSTWETLGMTPEEPDRRGRWVAFGLGLAGDWAFATADGKALIPHAATKHVQHVKVQGSRSPFEGDWAYWSSRWGHYPGIAFWMALLIRRQKGRCAH